jgi:hypothetical protein
MAYQKKAIEQKSVARHAIIGAVGALFQQVDDRLKIAHGITMNVNKIIRAMKKQNHDQVYA